MKPPLEPLQAFEKVKFESWNFTYCSEDDLDIIEKALKINPVFQEAIRIDTLIKKTGKTPQKAILKLMEETGELVSALEAKDSYKHGTIEHIQEETVDMLQCAISIYCLIQQQYPFDGAALMKAKNDKWESKYIDDDVEYQSAAEIALGQEVVWEGQSGPGESKNSGLVEMEITPAGTVIFKPTDDPKKAVTVKDLQKVFKAQGR